MKKEIKQKVLRITGIFFIFFGILFIFNAFSGLTGFTIIDDVKNKESSIIGIIFFFFGIFLVKQNKGLFFSIDALIAFSIIIVIMLIAFPVFKVSKYETNIHQDTLETLSSLKIAEINDPIASSLISQGKIKNLNRTLLESIGELYITDLNSARALANSTLKKLKTKENIGIWYGNTLLASTNSTPFETAENIDIARQTVSGIGEAGNGSVSGFSSKASLTSSKRSTYTYFGGYVGDGDLTFKVRYNGAISSAEIELAVNSQFNVIINSVSVAQLSPSVNDFTPVTYPLPITNFVSGENTIVLRSATGGKLHIAGGFIKVTYDPSVEYQQPTRYYFPGIEGLINLYDGFYIPSTPTAMQLYLHINSSQIPFMLTIGNTPIFNNVTTSGPTGEQIFQLNSAQLASLLNFNQLAQKTTPLRLGLEEISYGTTSPNDVDVISVNDISGSMAQTEQSYQLCIGENLTCCFLNYGFTCDFFGPVACQACGGIWNTNPPPPTKIELAKNATKVLIDEILNNTDSRVGLVAYQSSVTSTHPLSNNKITLKASVDSWIASGETCICCGINSAKNTFLSSGGQNKRAMIVMSDGLANVQCPQQPGANAKNDAILAACQARNETNATIYAIGFGNNTDQSTLQSIANCGNGSYYFANVSNIINIYRQIAQEITTTTYSGQTVSSTGSVYSKLYPDSYIEFNYSTPTTPFGMVIVDQEQFTSPNSGSFTVPVGANLIEAQITSYSGPVWTETLNVNSNPIYNINNYGSNYIEIGDPYSIYVPPTAVNSPGTANSVTLTTATAPGQTAQGSVYDKIIYTMYKNFSALSPITGIANGCIWNIQFEDNTEIQTKVPLSYNGSSKCYYNQTLPAGVTLRYDSNDAYQTAVFNLLLDLDLGTKNWKVDVSFTGDEIDISLVQVSGIPYTWSTEVQVRVWS